MGSQNEFSVPLGDSRSLTSPPSLSTGINLLTRTRSPFNKGQMVLETYYSHYEPYSLLPMMLVRLQTRISKRQSQVHSKWILFSVMLLLDTVLLWPLKQNASWPAKLCIVHGTIFVMLWQSQWPSLQHKSREVYIDTPYIVSFIRFSLSNFQNTMTWSLCELELFFTETRYARVTNSRAMSVPRDYLRCPNKAMEMEKSFLYLRLNALKLEMTSL
jgi:hypothetical protein